MSRKIKATDIDLTITTSTAIIVTIDSIKFVKDEQYPWIDIFLTGGEVDEFIYQDDSEKASEVLTLEQLKIYAINWVFNNVEVVENTALEVPIDDENVELKNLEGICKSVAEYLKSNYDPHCTIIITETQIKLVRDELGIPLEIGD